MLGSGSVANTSETTLTNSLATSADGSISLYQATVLISLASSSVIVIVMKRSPALFSVERYAFMMSSLVDQSLRFGAVSIRLGASEVKGPAVDCCEVGMIGGQIDIINRAEPN